MVEATRRFTNGLEEFEIFLWAWLGFTGMDGSYGVVDICSGLCIFASNYNLALTTRIEWCGFEGVVCTSLYMGRRRRPQHV